MSQPPSLRTLISVCVLLVISILSSAWGHAGVSLPPASDINEILAARFEPSTSRLWLRVYSAAEGRSNVGGLLHIDAKDQPPRTFEGDSADVSLQTAGWLRVTKDDWSLAYGRGMARSYEGNAEAAQLWIDLHAGGLTKAVYDARIGTEYISTSWFGLARSVPFTYRRLRGEWCAQLRHVTATDYCRRSIVGEARVLPYRESYSGLIKTISGRTSSDKIRGHAWCLDVKALVHNGRGTEALLTVEGLLGRMSWRGLYVDDGYFTSPGQFIDPEGLLHDFGGISGASWREDLSLALNPYYRLDVVHRRSNDTFASIEHQTQRGTAISIGMAWPQRKRWLPYVRYHLRHRKLEFGALGPGWQCRLAADAWSASSARNAEIGISARAVVF